MALRPVRSKELGLLGVPSIEYMHSAQCVLRCSSLGGWERGEQYSHGNKLK